MHRRTRAASCTCAWETAGIVVGVRAPGNLEVGVVRCEDRDAVALLELVDRDFVRICVSLRLI